MRRLVRTSAPEQLARQMHHVNIRLLARRNEELNSRQFINQLLPLRTHIRLLHYPDRRSYPRDQCGFGPRP